MNKVPSIIDKQWNKYVKNVVDYSNRLNQYYDGINYITCQHTDTRRRRLTVAASFPIGSGIIHLTACVIVLIIQTRSRDTHILDHRTVTNPTEQTCVVTGHTGGLLVYTVNHMSLTIKGATEPMFAFVVNIVDRTAQYRCPIR